MQFPALDRARSTFRGDGAIDLVDGQGALQLSIPAGDADRLRGHVSAYLDGIGVGNLEPITNRRTFGVLEMLRTGDPLRTGSIRTGEMLEIQLGIRAAGEEAIPVNYALLYPPSPSLDAVTGEQLLNGGPDGYGQVALVLQRHVLDRATFTNGDSSGTRGLIPPEGLSDAIVGSLVRRVANLERQHAHSELGEQLHGPKELTRLMASRDGTEVQRVLSAIPANSDGSRGVPAMPEVQVYGGISPSDVREIRVQRDAPPRAIEALGTAAAARGIPVKADLPMTRESMWLWSRETPDPRPANHADVERDWTALREHWIERSSSWSDG